MKKSQPPYALIEVTQLEGVKPGFYDAQVGAKETHIVLSPEAGEITTIPTQRLLCAPGLRVIERSGELEKPMPRLVCAPRQHVSLEGRGSKVKNDDKFF